MVHEIYSEILFNKLHKCMYNILIVSSVPGVDNQLKASVILSACLTVCIMVHVKQYKRLEGFPR